MRVHLYGTLLTGALAVVYAGVSGRAQDPPPDAQQGVDVQTRGPVHEAYATPTSLQPNPSPVIPKQPPEPIEEMPPDEKPAGDNVEWIPGYWAWDDDRNDYLWVSGIWRTPPPNRQWVPGSWHEVEGGWQWTNGFWMTIQQDTVQYLPAPPPPPPTAIPPAPGPEYTYVPGNYVYVETGYRWRPGVWAAFRPGWVYTPASYYWTPAGYVFVEGYWDYTLRERGVLFAPVYFDTVVYRRPGFYYRPSFVVYDDALYGALFVRPGFHGYVFGDYFEARYRDRGYRSWVDIRVGIGVGAPDPLFSYYRVAHRDTPHWDASIRELYLGRYNGSIERPPRTIVQQTTIINNITNNNTTIVRNNSTINNTVINNVKNVNVVAPITKVDKSVVNLTKITPQQQQQAAATARAIQQTAVQRVKLETQAAAAGPARPNSAPRTLKLDVPQAHVAAATNAAAAKAPPQSPVPEHHATPPVRTGASNPPTQPGTPGVRQPQPPAPQPVQPNRPQPPSVQPVPPQPPTNPRPQPVPPAAPVNPRPQPQPQPPTPQPQPPRPQPPSPQPAPVNPAPPPPHPQPAAPPPPPRQPPPPPSAGPNHPPPPPHQGPPPPQGHERDHKKDPNGRDNP